MIMKKLKLFLILIGFVSINAISQINPSNTCAGLTGANDLPVDLTGTCVANNYNLANSFGNSGFNSGCESSTDNDDGWFTFTAPPSGNVTIEEVSTNKRHMVAVHAVCGAGAALACQQSVANVTNTLNLTGLIPGNTYFIHMDRRQGGGGGMVGTICLYDTPDPDIAFPGVDLGTLACASTTNQTGNTTGANVDCGTSSAGDHIYQFTTTVISDVTIDLCASSYDTEIRLFSLAAGTCAAGALGTNDDACGVQSSLTMPCLAPGTYVVVIEGSGGATGAYDMDIVLSNCGCPLPLANDDPCTAEVLTVGATCVNTTGDLTTSTDSGVGDPTCANYGGQDVWYSVIVPASGQLEFETSTEPGGITDGGMAIYSGTCGSLTLIECDDDDGPGLMSAITDYTLTPGATIFIRVWEYGSNVEGEFNVCVYEPDCSANTTNDYCEDPGILTYGVGDNFASSTTNIYSADEPDNLLSEFCGSVENNSWYQFTANNTTETFVISTVTNCANNQGIQAQVYDYTEPLTGSACCAGFTAVSNCFSPGTNSGGTVTATGLTVGETYILMIDGFAGDNCDFVIDDWGATNILPVEFVDFKGFPNAKSNDLTWKTKSESNSRWFIVERSTTGDQFTEIGRLDAAGSSTQTLNYAFSDGNIESNLYYYRIKEMDFDGRIQLTNPLSIYRANGQVSFYPNPTTGNITFNFISDLLGEITITYTDISGKTIKENVFISEPGSDYKSEAMNELSEGIYIIQVFDAFGNSILQDKVIKK